MSDSSNIQEIHNAVVGDPQNSMQDRLERVESKLDGLTNISTSTWSIVQGIVPAISSTLTVMNVLLGNINANVKAIKTKVGA